MRALYLLLLFGELVMDIIPACFGVGLIVLLTLIEILLLIYRGSNIYAWIKSRSYHLICNFEPNCSELFCFYCILTIINRELLVRSGSVETHPGPLPKVTQNKLSIAIWNVDSLLSRNSAKLPILESIVNTYKFDIFGICESYLTDSVPDSALIINGFSSPPFRADCKNANSRARGGVCLYYKDDLPITRRPDLELLDECIIVEINLKRRKIFIILVYRTPSQSITQCKLFTQTLTYIYEKIAGEKPANIIISGDLNARSKLFWDGETRETDEGKIISDFMLLNGFNQIINLPTHFPRGEIATCIDLILTTQKYAFVDSGTLPSLDPACKHQIIYGKLNYSVPCPPPYKRTIWKYHLADTPSIQELIRNVDWNLCFLNKSVDEMVDIFNKVLLVIIKSLIPNKVVTINDRDAPWVTPEMKTAIRRNTKTYKNWVKKGRNPDTRDIVKSSQIAINKLISRAKTSYLNDLSNKLIDKKNGQKVFWSAYKRLLNNKKLSNIPPLFEKNEYISIFKTKANIFNNFFADQCKPFDINSILPPFLKRTNNLLTNIQVSEKTISDIINKLDAKKAHGFDGISIAMLKICSLEISIPLCIIFNKCVQSGAFPSLWKKANVQPVHKKNSRQDKTNYRPISLLPICGKIFEKVIFDTLYPYLHFHKLLTKNQSGFKPGDSTINQLLNITDEIYRAFESYDETRAVFLDMSKAFDKVWHEGLIFKLRQYGVDGNLLLLLSDYLMNRSQRVVLNGLHSDWMDIHSGVPQGSVLGPLLFLIYINDLTDDISSNIKLFADDSSLFIRVHDVDTAQRSLTSDLEKITRWANQWKMKFNPDITKQAIEVIFSWKKNKPVHPPLQFNGIPVARKQNTKHLGIILDERLTFRPHILESIEKAKKGISIMKFLSKYVNREVLNLTYKMYVRPHFDYGDVIYHNQSKDSMDLLDKLQYQSALIVTGCWKGTSRVKIFSELGWESLADRRILHRLSLFYKIKNNDAPEYLCSLALESVPQRCTDRYKISFFPHCYKLWNEIDGDIRTSTSLPSFKSKYIQRIRPLRKSCFSIRNRYGLSLLTRIRVGHSDLRSHRFNKNFNCLSPLCACGIEDETPEHFFLRCPRFVTQRHTLFDSITDILNPEKIICPPDHLTLMLMYGKNNCNDITNKLIVECSIRFIQESYRFKNLEAFSAI